MEKKNNQLLREASSSFKKKKYGDAILLLEKIVASDPRDPYPHLLLAVSLLLTDQFNRADPVLKRLKIVDPSYAPGWQLESFLFLKSAGGSEAALSRYIDMLQKFPSDRYFRRALRQIRRTGDFSSFQKRARLHRFVNLARPGRVISPLPRRVEIRRPLRRLSPGIKIAALFIPVIALAAGLLLFFGSDIQRLFRAKKSAGLSPERNLQVDLVEVDGSRYELIDRIGKEKTPVFYFSSEEVLKDFQRAKYLIKDDKHTDAMVLLNRIAASNAHFTVKEKAEFLRKFVLNIEDREPSEVSFREVSRSPHLYRGLILRWSGKVANLKRKDGKILFNLLVDYQDRDTFAGIADVFSGRDYDDVRNGDSVLVTAVFVNTVGNDNRIYLVARGIDKSK